MQHFLPQLGSTAFSSFDCDSHHMRLSGIFTTNVSEDVSSVFIRPLVHQAISKKLPLKPQVSNTCQSAALFTGKTPHSSIWTHLIWKTLCQRSSTSDMALKVTFISGPSSGTFINGRRQSLCFSDRTSLAKMKKNAVLMNSRNSKLPMETSSLQSVVSHPETVFQVSPGKGRRRKLLSRLFTNQDSFGLHKLSAIVYLFASGGLLMFGVVVAIRTGQFFLPQAHLLRPAFFVWVVSTIVMSASGIHIALRYKERDVLGRNVFISTSLSNILTAWMTFYCTPIIPSSFMISSFFDFMTLLLGIATVVSTCDIMMKNGEVIESRRKLISRSQSAELEKTTPAQLNYISDFFTYIFPLAWGLPFYILGPYLCIRKGYASFVYGLPRIQSHPGLMLYAMVLGILSASICAFLATLFERKVISGKVEKVFIVIVNVGTLLVLLLFSVISMENLKLFLWHNVLDTVKTNKMSFPLKCMLGLSIGSKRVHQRLNLFRSPLCGNRELA